MNSITDQQGRDINVIMQPPLVNEPRAVTIRPRSPESRLRPARDKWPSAEGRSRILRATCQEYLARQRAGKLAPQCTDLFREVDTRLRLQPRQDIVMHHPIGCRDQHVLRLHREIESLEPESIRIGIEHRCSNGIEGAIDAAGYSQFQNQICTAPVESGRHNLQRIADRLGISFPTSRWSSRRLIAGYSARIGSAR